MAFICIDESTAITRIIMLKRMKERLIAEWHPILDVLIGDYEGGLNNLKAGNPDEHLDGDEVRQIYNWKTGV